MNSGSGPRLFAALALAASAALAQDYPSRAVHIVVPSAPGGGYDVIGRLLAESFTQQLGAAFVVENRPGAGTLIGTQAVATAPPDGYTLLIGGLANMAFNPALHQDMRYDPVRDFAPVAMVGAFTYALVGRRDLPQPTFGELVDFARAHPGKLSIATSGIGTGQHISALLLKHYARIDLLEVTYKGAQPAYLDLLAGRVDLFFDNTTTARPFIADGRVKAYVTSGSVRDALLPDVPTAAQAGLRDFVLDSWLGLFAPAKTPAAVIERLRSATHTMLENAELRRRLEANGWRIISMSREEMQAFVKREAQKWPPVLRQAGIRPQ
ncbi:MAG TPA: tripartite tricarboxylate transporter substrate binding protein [Burkholderiales bacterium]|nr:tripartite tricarboxylate transporter substrate binding protein [Burkholderiales bacterium]